MQPSNITRNQLRPSSLISQRESGKFPRDNAKIRLPQPQNAAGPLIDQRKRPKACRLTQLWLRGQTHKPQIPSVCSSFAARSTQCAVMLAHQETCFAASSRLVALCQNKKAIACHGASPGFPRRLAETSPHPCCWEREPRERERGLHPLLMRPNKFPYPPGSPSRRALLGCWVRHVGMV